MIHDFLFRNSEQIDLTFRRGEAPSVAIAIGVSGDRQHPRQFFLAKHDFQIANKTLVEIFGFFFFFENLDFFDRPIEQDESQLIAGETGNLQRKNQTKNEENRESF